MICWNVEHTMFCAAPETHGAARSGISREATVPTSTQHEHAQILRFVQVLHMHILAGYWFMLCNYLLTFYYFRSQRARDREQLRCVLKYIVHYTMLFGHEGLFARSVLIHPETARAERKQKIDYRNTEECRWTTIICQTNCPNDL